MPLRLLTPAGRFDRSAIMRAAWACARAAVAPRRPVRGYTPSPPPSLRRVLADAQRRMWDLARGERACIEHHAAMDAEDARRSALPPFEREILVLRDARTLAPMNDSTRHRVAELAAIDARALAIGVRL